MSGQYPKSIDDIVTAGFDRIVSMGCGVECPTLPLDDDWGLEDPVGRGEAFYRKTLEEIKQRLLTMD